MKQQCPHCGEELGIVTDAFCPECRQSLSEAPAPTDASEKVPVTSQPRSFRLPSRRGQVQGWACALAGAVATVIGLVTLISPHNNIIYVGALIGGPLLCIRGIYLVRQA
jgi:hypothetical protein